MSLLKENNCDLLALTYDGKIMGYTKKDKDVKNWLEQGEGYDWFCVDLED